MKTVRHLDWPERLAAFVEGRRFTPFVWGGNDCCLFAADAVLAITGTDLALDHRGRYADARGALEIVGAPGGLAGLVDLPGRDPGLARRGDVVLAEMQGREVLGVCVGADYAAPGADGLVFRPMNEARRAWEV